MSDVLFNDRGYPVMAVGKSYSAVVTGMPSDKSALAGQRNGKNSNAKNIIEIKTKLDDKSTVEKTTVASWGTNNNFPLEAEAIIDKTGVLNTGLRFIRDFTIGQGIYPCTVTGFDADGNEVLAPVNIPEIKEFLGSRVVTRYLSLTLRDRLKFGVAFPELLMNEDGSKIMGISPTNAVYCRLAEKQNGNIPSVVISGDFPDSPADGNHKVVTMLEQYDPYAHLDRLRMAKKTAGKTFIYPMRDEWSNKEYYTLPIWYPGYLSGWVQVAHKVPVFLMKMYENMITIKWHIKIPYAYWEKRYPETIYKDKAEREALIQAEMDRIEESLVGETNANKAVFTMFEINANSRAEEQWVFEPLDSKKNTQENLIASAAANSEILFALMINPNVFGAGMPGGTYSGNQGGSNIREAFLVNIALAWLDRQELLDPIEAMLAYNGYPGVQLRFRNTILTTLDTGAGTTKTLS